MMDLRPMMEKVRLRASGILAAPAGKVPGCGVSHDEDVPGLGLRRRAARR